MKSGASCITLFFSEKMMFFLFFFFYCHCNLFSCFLTDSYFFIQLPAFFFFLIPVILLFHPLFYNPVQNFHKLFRDSTLLPIWFVRLSVLFLFLFLFPRSCCFLRFFTFSRICRTTYRIYGCLELSLCFF